MVIWCLKWQMKTPDSTKRLTISLFVDQDERHWLYHYEFSLRKSILLVVRKILLTLFWYIYISFLDVGVDIDIQGKNNYNQVFLGLYARKIWHVWWMSSRIMGVWCSWTAEEKIEHTVAECVYVSITLAMSFCFSILLSGWVICVTWISVFHSLHLRLYIFALKTQSSTLILLFV